MIDKRCLKDLYLQIMTLERVLRFFHEELDHISVNQVSLKHQWLLGICGTHYTEEKNKQLKSDLANLCDKSRVVLRSKLKILLVLRNGGFDQSSPLCSYVWQWLP